MSQLTRSILAVLLLTGSLLLLLPIRETVGNEPSFLTAETLSEKILRLHILADRNDTLSQEIKLSVRDAVLNFLSERLPENASLKETEEALSHLLPEVVAVADAELFRLSADYSSSAKITTRFFPIKQYGSLLLPPGRYRALEITLGKGTGRNWWCMLYPSLCFTEGITGTLPEEEQEELRGLLTEEEYDLLFTKKKKPVFRLKICQIFKKLFRSHKSEP